MKRYYVAYGSNLNVRQMRWRCPGARIIGTSELKDYRLLFKGSKTGSYLTIEPEVGCTVPVAVWEVTGQDELALDRYEGFPSFYYKKELVLDVKGELFRHTHAQRAAMGHDVIPLDPWQVVTRRPATLTRRRWKWRRPCCRPVNRRG